MKKAFFKLKMFISVISIAITLVFAFVLWPKINKITSTWGIAEIAIFISIVSLVVQLTPPFIESKFNKLNEAFYEIHFNIKILDDGNVSFAADIENKGIKTIHPKYTRLYIDQGMTKADGVFEYGFPFMLEHKNNDDGTEDCVLCRRCKAEDNKNYPIDLVPEPFKTEMINNHLFTGCFELEHLSSKSIKYIRAHERFQEDIIINFSQSGVYRATLIVVTDDADCQCATKQFYINQKTTRR